MIFEPFGEFFELLALRDAREHGLATRLGGKRLATLKFMRYVVGAWSPWPRRHEPWVFWHDVARRVAGQRGALRRLPVRRDDPDGRQRPAHLGTEPVDGVVVVSPRGCAPALVSEAQLRRGAGFPLLLVYNDGDPIDETRLAGFAWRLRARPRREREPAARPSAAVRQRR